MNHPAPPSSNPAARDGLRVDDVNALHDMADAMPQLVWITNANGTIEYCNSRWYDYTGTTADQSPRAGWDEIIHADDREPSKAAWQQSLASGEPYETEYRVRRATDGEFRWHLVRGLPARDAAGRIVRWFGTCTDIHDRKTAEQKLQTDKERSDNAGRAKDAFLSIVSHELRTPLSAILGWTQLLEMDVLDDAERREAILTIKQQAKVQSQLIEDLLDVSRILNGKFHLRSQFAPLADIVRGALKVSRPMAASEGITLQQDESDPTLIVDGDPQRLQQSVTNLLNCAIRFTPKDGTIRVAVGGSDGVGRVTVLGGKDIPVGQIEAIFDGFKREGGDGIRDKGGLGLGLSIVQHVIDAHRGTVHAEADGQCTRIEMRLPTVASPPGVDGVAHASIDLPADEASLLGKRVLVVDDEESARTVVAAALRKSGSEVTTAKDANEAWDKLAGQPFDILVSDLGMPGDNGLDLIGRVRQQGGGFRGIPAIALTGFASVDDQTRALGAGFDVHVSKPVEPSELVRHILGLTRAKAPPA